MDSLSISCTFIDAVALRYGRQLQQLPSTCACGAKVSADHSLSCPKGGPSLCHNDIRDVTASLLTEICHEREYKQHVHEIEHATFTPLVLSATGGMASQATHFYKRLASCLASKWDQSYSHTTSWVRCRLTFSLLRSASNSASVEQDPVLGTL